MKKTSRLIVPVYVAVLLSLFLAVPPVFASAEDHMGEALSASKAWIAQIDAKKYDDSYAFTCDAMRDKVPQDRWVDVLKALRSPWGSVLARRQISHVYHPNGLTGLSGECVVIMYDTSFQKMDPAMEEVVLKWEGGKWRGAGYNAGPKESSETASAPPPDPNTETHTEAHVHAQPQTP